MKGCHKCLGTNVIRGGGMVDYPCDHDMVIEDCEHCGGSGKIKYKLDKQSDGYQKAKNDIKQLDDNITDEEAEKMLDDGIQGNKKGRKK